MKKTSSPDLMAGETVLLLIPVSGAEEAPDPQLWGGNEERHCGRRLLTICKRLTLLEGRTATIHRVNISDEDYKGSSEERR